MNKRLFVNIHHIFEKYDKLLNFKIQNVFKFDNFKIFSRIATKLLFKSWKLKRTHISMGFANSFFQKGTFHKYFIHLRLNTYDKWLDF